MLILSDLDAFLVGLNGLLDFLLNIHSLYVFNTFLTKCDTHTHTQITSCASMDYVI